MIFNNNVQVKKCWRCGVVVYILYGQHENEKLGYGYDRYERVGRGKGHYSLPVDGGWVVRDNEGEFVVHTVKRCFGAPSVP